MRKAKLYLLNGIMLAGVTLALRFLGMAYNVYISGKLGAEGMGLISLVLSVYSLALTFASSGVNLTCTRLCADALALNSPKEAARALRGCMLYSLLFGVLSSVLLFSLSGVIGTRILKDARTVLSLKALSLVLPASALTTAMTGYFAAVRRVPKSGAVVLLEQCLKIIFTALLLPLAFTKGAGVTVVFASSAAAELISFLILSVILFFDKRKHLPKTGDPFPGLAGRILSISLPVAFTAWVRSGLVTAEHVLIPKGLADYGSGAALATYGEMHGMALPVVLFPTAVLTAFTSLLIPEISRLKAEKKQKDIDFSASGMLRITLLFSAFCSGFLMLFGKELGVALYRNENVGKMIALFAPLVPVMYIDTAADSVLKGLGEQVYCMKVNILDAFLSLLLVYLSVPRLGVTGYVLTVFISETVNTFFSLLRLYKKAKIELSVLFSVVLPIGVSLFVAWISRFFFKMLSLPLGASLCLTALLFFAPLYIFLVCLLGCFQKQDRRYFRRIFKKN